MRWRSPTEGTLTEVVSMQSVKLISHPADRQWNGLLLSWKANMNFAVASWCVSWQLKICCTTFPIHFQMPDCLISISGQGTALSQCHLTQQHFIFATISRQHLVMEKPEYLTVTLMLLDDMCQWTFPARKQMLCTCVRWRSMVKTLFVLSFRLAWLWNECAHSFSGHACCVFWKLFWSAGSVYWEEENLALNKPAYRSSPYTHNPLYPGLPQFAVGEFWSTIKKQNTNKSIHNYAFAPTNILTLLECALPMHIFPSQWRKIFQFFQMEFVTSSGMVGLACTLDSTWVASGSWWTWSRNIELTKFRSPTGVTAVVQKCFPLSPAITTIISNCHCVRESWKGSLCCFSCTSLGIALRGAKPSLIHHVAYSRWIAGRFLHQNWRHFQSICSGDIWSHNVPSLSLSAECSCPGRNHHVPLWGSCCWEICVGEFPCNQDWPSTCVWGGSLWPWWVYWLKKKETDLSHCKNQCYAIKIFISMFILVFSLMRLLGHSLCFPSKPSCNAHFWGARVFIFCLSGKNCTWVRLDFLGDVILLGIFSLKIHIGLLSWVEVFLYFFCRNAVTKEMVNKLRTNKRDSNNSFRNCQCILVTLSHKKRVKNYFLWRWHVQTKLLYFQ